MSDSCPRARVILFGADTSGLEQHIVRHPCLMLVDTDPDVVICFGGDGTLLSAELRWPGVPKVPLRNSRRGRRCMPHPPQEIIQRLADQSLHSNQFMKLAGIMHGRADSERSRRFVAMNEFNVHMGRINSAVRFQLWIDESPFQDGIEIVGDGFVVATPFGSTAYFHQITHGVFYAGIGIAFKYTTEHTNHLVVPDTATLRFVITRGPAVLAFDNAPEFLELHEGDELTFQKHDRPATLFTWEPVLNPCDVF